MIKNNLGNSYFVAGIASLIFSVPIVGALYCNHVYNNNKDIQSTNLYLENSNCETLVKDFDKKCKVPKKSEFCNQLEKTIEDRCKDYR